jgi:hypothetical protein
MILSDLARSPSPCGAKGLLHIGIPLKQAGRHSVVVCTDLGLRVPGPDRLGLRQSNVVAKAAWRHWVGSF